ncbi:hypothetical protein VFPFJ_04950 [Purpureocillium lilacinum]|uniref:Uncharacterized protein n=1 Tax=Purpureocillium lilacinum TaxID=33203 RepID=A0A179HML9_PURLI|nr:hypothetical protein VFPFJ_04950 [Purpureocillium lilacinum]OAQ90791.1 hypothetical protein VFPFJ_04950 [Purpureocillium lilacinum]
MCKAKEGMKRPQVRDEVRGRTARGRSPARVRGHGASNKRGEEIGWRGDRTSQRRRIPTSSRSLGPCAGTAS